MRDLDDAVLFACGGAACRTVSGTGFDRVCAFLMNPREAAAGNPAYQSPMGRGEEGAIEEAVQGSRVVFVYAMLGGDSGTAMMDRVIQCARQAGCRTVSIAGVPWSSEVERRERAIAAVKRIEGAADRLFLMDMDTVVKLNWDAKADPSFRIMARTASFAIDNLAAIVDGPFFSTFPEKAYTFAYVNDIDPAQAVERALGATVFPTDPVYGKAIVTVSSGFGTAQTEQIYNAVVSNTGIIPDIVKRDDREDTKVLVFLPVRLAPSPTASRS